MQAQSVSGVGRIKGASQLATGGQFVGQRGGYTLSTRSIKKSQEESETS
jgi:hypothetical protein